MAKGKGLSSPFGAAPASLQKALERLGAPAGLVTVAYGQGLRDEDWQDERALCVFVRHKRTLEELVEEDVLPTKLGRYRVDVLEAPLPELYTLDHTDRTLYEGRERPASLTAVVPMSQGRGRGLLSGHAALPRDANGRIVNRYGPKAQTKVDILVRGGGQEVFRGRLRRGRMGGPWDWAIADFAAPEVETWHLAAGRRPPLPMRRTKLKRGEKLRLFSSLPSRRRIYTGAFRQVTVRAITLSGPGGLRTAYTELGLVYSPTSRPMSLHGDSGSLVVDDAGRAVGQVVGGWRNDKWQTTCVAPIRKLRTVLGDDFGRFFK